MIIKSTAPEFWACYLFNGDDTALPLEEKEAVHKWLAYIGASQCDIVACEDAGFIRKHEAFSFWPFAATCQEYNFVIPERKI